MLRRKVLPPSKVHWSFLWLDRGPGSVEELSSQPSISQCLRLGMVSLGVSVIFHSSTRPAFVPPAAFTLAGPPCQSGTHTTFLGHSSLSATTALCPFALTKFWFTHIPSPHGILLTSPYCLTRCDPLTGSLECLPLPHLTILDSFLWQSFDWLFLVFPTFTFFSNTLQIHCLLLLDILSYQNHAP